MWVNNAVKIASVLVLGTVVGLWAVTLKAGQEEATPPPATTQPQSQLSAEAVPLAVVASGGSTQPSDSPLQVGQVYVSDEPILDTDSCIVRRIYVDVPEGTPTALLNMQFRWKDQLSADMSSGYGSTATQSRSLVVVVVGQLAAITGTDGKWVQVVTVTTSCEGAMNTFASKVEQKDKLADHLTMGLKPGTYQLDEDIVIGEMTGTPITLAVSPEKLRKALEKK